MGKNLQWILLGLSVLGMLAACGAAIYYKRQHEILTERVAFERSNAEARERTLASLLSMEVQSYEKRISQLEAGNAALSSSLDGVRKRAATLQKRLDSASTDECKKRSRELLADLTRGAELAGKCAQELGRKSEALNTCVRVYEEVKSVYDPAQ